MLRTFASILLLLVLSASVLAQAEESTGKKEKSNGRGPISGRVVSESGGPLLNALVHVREHHSSTSHTARTDSNGAFQINDLEPADYFVSAMAPAYITPPPDPTATRSLSYRPGDSVTLTLVKGGVITGKVVNLAGEPVVWISVRVQMIRAENDAPYGPSGPTRETPTDDRGVYRVYGLMPGTYIVSAGGKSDLSRSSRFVNAFDSDVATYAPSSLREDAAEIKLRAGEEVAGVDIRHRAEQGRSVSGKVQVPPNTDTRFSVTLTAAGEGNALWQTEYHQTSDSQNFVFNGIRDGDYDVVAHSWTQTGERGASEGKRISVRGGDVEGIVLSTKPFASIAGRMVIEEPTIAECTEKERLPFQQTMVIAAHNETAAAKRTPQSVWSMGGPQVPNAEGNFVLERLVAGEYFFATRLHARSWYLRSVVLTPPAAPGAKAAPKPVDVTRVWTKLKPGDKVSGLTLTLGHGAGSLRGQLEVGEGQEAPRRSIVYLVPAERERADDVLRYFATGALPQGSFAFDNVPPGRYWILAQRRVEGETLPLSQLSYPESAAVRTRVRREAEAAKNEIEFKPCQEVNDFKLPLKLAGQ